MKYTEVSIKTTREGSELIADLLTGMGSMGVSIYDKEDLIDLVSSNAKWDYIDNKLLSDLADFVRVCGFFSVKKKNLESQVYERLADLLTRCELDLGSCEVTLGEADDAQWFENWKKYYKPVKISRITLVPEWCEPPKQVVGQVVWLNPGVAFGTGEHETTRGCIELLQHVNRYQPLKDRSVIDLGCGSGVLGIVAATLGSRTVWMVDIDPVAVSAARHNTALNHREDVIEIVQGNLFEQPEPKGDVIVANITADLLIASVADLGAHLNPEGMLILSGILDTRLAEVTNAYAAAGFAVAKDVYKGEWHSLLLRKKHAGHSENPPS